jgi:hypothetical protein
LWTLAFILFCACVRDYTDQKKKRKIVKFWEIWAWKYPNADQHCDSMSIETLMAILFKICDVILDVKTVIHVLIKVSAYTSP